MKNQPKETEPQAVQFKEPKELSHTKSGLKTPQLFFVKSQHRWDFTKNKT